MVHSYYTSGPFKLWVICDTHGVTLRYHRSRHVYTHTHYLHTRVFTRVHACMDNVASYLPFSPSNNATVLVTLFFPYRILAAHQEVEDEIVEEVESTMQV